MPVVVKSQVTDIGCCGSQCTPVFLPLQSAVVLKVGCGRGPAEVSDKDYCDHSFVLQTNNKLVQLQTRGFCI